MRHLWAVTVPECNSPITRWASMIIFTNGDRTENLRYQAAQVGVKSFREYLMLVVEIEDMGINVLWAAADPDLEKMAEAGHYLTYQDMKPPQTEL